MNRHRLFLDGAGKSVTPARSASTIAAHTREYLDASSPRSEQSETDRASEERHGAAAPQIAAHQTLESKLDVCHELFAMLARRPTLSTSRYVLV